MQNDPARLLRYRDSIYAGDLLVCAVAHLNIFTFLNVRPRTFQEICERLSIDPRPTDVLLSLLLAMELLETDGNTYAVNPVSGQYLVSDSPDTLVPYYSSLKNRPQSMEFLEVLKTGKPAGWSSKKEGRSWLASMKEMAFADAFTLAMDSRGGFLARQLARKLDLHGYASILDVAGGSGIYACALARQNPHVRAAVLEIPPVDAATRRSVENKKMKDRVCVLAGDMFAGIPHGYDVHLFANVFHDWGLDAVKTLAAQAFKSLAPGGSILVFDAHLNEDKRGPLTVAEYSCLLVHSTEGRCYSTRETGEVLLEAGFEKISVTQVAADRSVVAGIKS